MLLSPQADNPNGTAFDLALTRTLVPLKDMSEAHLLDLLHNSSVEMTFAGQTLFSAGKFDGDHFYLLHGDVALTDAKGNRCQVKGRSTLMPLSAYQPRRETAVAETDGSILRIDGERLDKLLTWSQVSDYLQLNMSRQRDLDEDFEWMMTVLKSNLFFKVPPINVEHIFSRLEPQVVYAGDTIIRQGELGDCCYFIKEGQADVIRHQGEQRQHLATITTGRCFGEDALVNDAPRNASVRMLTDGVLMRLSKNDFYRLLREPRVDSLPLANMAKAVQTGAVYVDMRSEEEYSEGHLACAANIPLSLLAIKSRLLSKEVQYICYCNTGRRSRAAAHLLKELGHNAVALEDCPSLFNDPEWETLLERDSNYVLRHGRAVLGQ
ncbi:cyclic nucleotide-binding domain-containing protein [Marinimicrobium sp. ABcell2]|uniref:cyclic nucleotide-binding domain-containing protein n=1 Tax=Marinimicrobium sp. ABcell2 TaxID=3069751 RepID=UPI0027B03B18|nr:cyclic nucleotide-binding domain-containing protein [Marinimicrobium sp. ABcell2]MDQ2078013.1 cyclic nucleotide-binding domain-containing protein [Marinimicrobium sp. ABcell2]